MQDFLHGIEQFLGPIGQIFHYVFYLPVYNILMVIYEGLNKVIPGGAFALAIIILTLMIRAALIPLTRKQLASTRKMQMIQPELKALQQQYRGDAQTLMAEQRKLYKENGVSMYGGCLPLLVQMPFLYALYYSLFTLISNNLGRINGDLYSFVPRLQHLPKTWFLWTSLATPDVWHILPVVAALLTFIQLRMAMPVRKPRQPGENPDPTTQATATTQYIMPLITLFIGWTFPAGLALYWCISTGFSAVQQYFINGNWGSLFVGVPGMQHLVPPPKELPSSATRPAIATNTSARALAPAAAETAPAEGGLRGWWQRIRESASAAQTQAMERAELARQEREEAAAQARQQAANGTDGKASVTPPRRQRPARQGPTLVKPPTTSSQSTNGDTTGDDLDAAIQQGTDQRVLPEQTIANGSNGTNGALKTSSANGANGANGAKMNGNSSVRNGANGTRPAAGGSNAARRNTAKGGSGARSRGGRPKGGR